MNPLMKKLLESSTTKYTSILSESVMFNEKDKIPTDIPIINAAFCGSLHGGISSGTTLICGKSRTFKSLISLVCVKAYLNKYKDAVCVLYDSEGGMTPSYLRDQGVDPARVIHIPIEHLEMLKFDIVNQLKNINRGDKVIFVIDSIGNTASLKELLDAQDERTVADMQRAKVIKSIFRMITPSLVSKDIPCMTICHTYDEMSLFPKQIISGGTGLIYSANQAFIISKSQDKGSDGDLDGFFFTINIEKSRFVKEKSKLIFNVKFETGIDRFSGLLDLALECGLVKKPSNGWYSKVDPETGEISDKKYREKDTHNKDFWDSILFNAEFDKFVQAKYKLGTAISMEEDIQDLTEDD
jgi:hypothetical protein